MTAREYYLQLCEKNRYNPEETVSDSAVWLMVKKFKASYPNYSEDKLFEIAKRASVPTTKMEALLTEFINGIPHSYKLNTTDIYAGEIPVHEINASCQAPSGGYLILFHYGLNKAFHEWAKKIAEIVLWLSDSQWIKQIPTYERIASDLVASIDNYVKKGDIPLSVDTAWNPKLEFSSLISANGAIFVLAHEYSHAFLGHLNHGFGSQYYDDKLDLEIQTDKTAADILMKGSFWGEANKDIDFRNMNREFKLMGIYYALNIMQVIALRKSEKEQKPLSHPTITRVGVMRDYLDSVYRPEHQSYYRLIIGAFDFVYEHCQIASRLVTQSSTTMEQDTAMKSVGSEQQQTQLPTSARIIDIQKGELRGHATMNLTIDKGTNDGIFIGEVFFVQGWHPAIILELRVIKVEPNRSNLMCWYDSSLKVGNTITLKSNY